MLHMRQEVVPLDLSKDVDLSKNVDLCKNVDLSKNVTCAYRR